MGYTKLNNNILLFLYIKIEVLVWKGRIKGNFDNMVGWIMDCFDSNNCKWFTFWNLYI